MTTRMNLCKSDWHNSYEMPAEYWTRHFTYKQLTCFVCLIFWRIHSNWKNILLKKIIIFAENIWCAILTVSSFFYFWINVVVSTSPADSPEAEVRRVHIFSMDGRTKDGCMHQVLSAFLKYTILSQISDGISLSFLVHPLRKPSCSYSIRTTTLPKTKWKFHLTWQPSREALTEFQILF